MRAHGKFLFIIPYAHSQESLFLMRLTLHNGQSFMHGYIQYLCSSKGKPEIFRPKQDLKPDLYDTGAVFLTGEMSGQLGAGQ